MSRVSVYNILRFCLLWIALGVAWGYDWNGYVESNSQWIRPMGEESYGFHGLQNRINGRFPMLGNGGLEVSNRTLIYTGPQKMTSPRVAQQLSEDSGWVDATWAWSVPKYHSLLYTTWDRLFWEWRTASSVIRMGRQRVNWGASRVWNPNDWFHASDYLDLNYTEKRGVDAVRWQWFPGTLWILEGVYQGDATVNGSTVAALGRWNQWGYDWQMQMGWIRKEWAGAVAWMGDVLGAGFSGEVSLYYDPQSYHRDRSIQYVWTMGFDHMFSNGWYVNVSGLYNGYSLHPEDSLISPQWAVTSQTLISKEVALFWEWSYSLNPWVSVKWGTFQSPQDFSFCTMPGLEVSYFENVDWTGYGIICQGEGDELYGDKGTMLLFSLRAYY